MAVFRLSPLPGTSGQAGSVFRSDKAPPTFSRSRYEVKCSLLRMREVDGLRASPGLLRLGSCRDRFCYARYGRRNRLCPTILGAKLPALGRSSTRVGRLTVRALVEERQVTEEVLGGSKQRELDPLERAVGGVEETRALLSDARKALEEMKRKELQMGHNDTSLISTPVHRAWVAAGFLAILGMLTKSGVAVASGDSLLTAVVGAFAAFVLSDLGTGIYHWGVDNYGDGSTPVFGAQIDAFQGHHKRPWTIYKREFANNLHALARPAFFFLLPCLFSPNSAGIDAFLGVFLACVVMSQQCHAWAHTPRPLLPPFVVSLQDAGLLVGRRMHGTHHRPPYNVNYCIVSGWGNRPLVHHRLLPWMEVQIYRWFGIPPRSWGETAAEWLQEVSYYAEGEEAVEM
eukprot:TRINITY_DN22575_c0_g1_i1.p1 TRINITY_DN22575_c0_g1~~TRINITY_DN22575_c0_g1_i1.p1  ORF type:complete len:417 (-),score=25.20 TRINITY_DN22575_c0_g1_i1:1349-2548(-)